MLYGKSLRGYAMPDKKILVVEDNKGNQNILSSTLSDMYEIILTENGKQALETVKEQGEEISVILLDLFMPEMNGFEFLEIYRKDVALPRIPIIVMTSSDSVEEELKCLELGATDFIRKPYNTEITKKRIEKTIAVNEAATLLEDFERDPVLNIYSRNIFLSKVTGILKTNLDTEYDIICLEIEEYRLMLDRYGSTKCKDFQRKAFKEIFKVLPEKTVMGKLESSQVAILLPHQEEQYYKVVLKEALIKIGKKGVANAVNGIIKGGVYENVEHALAVETACNNAIMAIGTIREHYGVYLVRYDDSLRRKASEKQFILENMTKALEQHEFEAYYQPKYNILQEQVGGAEALVRWIHPEKGMISPGEFIPVFEQNGFISELDRYMLETVCSDLKRWIEEGKDVVPVSINVSQVDFDNRNLAEEYTEIVDSFGIDHSLIHFEITESANATDAEKKKYNVLKFREKGFLIELDDFGAGYASLSSLSDLPIDVLKLDMSLVKKMFERKHSAVLSGALYTVRELELKVVAEGVETKEQIQELKWKGAYIDDLYIQGYYFSKPVPAKDFEKFITKQSIDETPASSNKVNVEYETFNREEYSKMNEQYTKEQLLKKYRALIEHAGVVIYEYDPYADKMILETWKESGEICRRCSEHYLEQLPNTNWIEEKYVDSYIDTIRYVAKSGVSKSIVVSAILAGGSYGLCRFNFTPIKDKDGIVERIVARAYLIEYSDGTEIIDNLPVAVLRYNPEDYSIDYVSSSVVELLEFGGKEEFRSFYANSFANLIYERDRKKAIEKIETNKLNREPGYVSCRVKKADGSTIRVYETHRYSEDRLGKLWCNVVFAKSEMFSKKAQKTVLGSENTMELRAEDMLEGVTSDQLTGLLNKESGAKIVQKYLDINDHGTLVMFDLDDFNTLNETRGHMTGDEVIKSVASVIKEEFENYGIVCRYGGDEFMCYLPDNSDTEQIENSMKTILEKIKEKDGTSISAGAAYRNDDVQTVDDLVNMADTVVYKVKRVNKGSFGFYI